MNKSGHSVDAFFSVDSDDGEIFLMATAKLHAGRPGTYWDPPESDELDDLNIFRTTPKGEPLGEALDDDECIALGVDFDALCDRLVESYEPDEGPDYDDQMMEDR